MQCSWTRIHLAPCDTRVPYLHEQRGPLVSKDQRLRCRRVDQIQYVPLSRHCHCMGEQRKERSMYVRMCMYLPDSRIREHAQIGTGRRGCSRRGRGRSGGSARCACSSTRRWVSTAQKFHSSFIGKLPSTLEEFPSSSVVTHDHSTVGSTR
jgi:hypothetical protein